MRSITLMRRRPPGRLARAAAAAPGRHAAENGGGIEDDAGDVRGRGGDADDDDDGEEDPDFAHFYRVSPHQREFNSTSAKAYRKGELDRKVTRVVPPKVLPNGCQPEHIGLGAFHMHAPHLEMGFVLPPCPRCAAGSRGPEEGQPQWPFFTVLARKEKKENCAAGAQEHQRRAPGGSTCIQTQP